MKYIQVIALAVFFHLVLNLFMPWWNIFFAGLIAGYFSKTNSLKTFIFVFLGIAVYWMILLIKIDHSNHGILASRVSQMLNLENKTILFLLNSGLGALCAASGSIVGYHLKKIVRSYKEGLKSAAE